MLGRYIGQITARIQRAWIRPRTPIGSDLFACRVRIIQDRSGGVTEVELAHVFLKSLTVEFTAEPFVPGGRVEGFERESRPVP
jgi:hypothetical protein